MKINFFSSDNSTGPFTVFIWSYFPPTVLPGVSKKISETKPVLELSLTAPTCKVTKTNPFKLTFCQSQYHLGSSWT